MSSPASRGKEKIKLQAWSGQASSSQFIPKEKKFIMRLLLVKQVLVLSTMLKSLSTVNVHDFH